MMLIYIALGITLLCTLIMILPLYITLEYSRMEQDDNFKIILSPISGLLKIKLKVPYVDIKIKNNQPQIDIKEEIGNQISARQRINLEGLGANLSNFSRLYKSYKEGLLYFNSKINVDKLEWETEIGFEDAAATGIISGLMLITKGSLISFLTDKYRLKTAKINVVPVFNRHYLKTNIHCIIHFKPGYAIIAAVKVLLVKLKEVI